MAFVLALLHLGVLAARNFARFKDSMEWTFVFNIFWVLWLVMPMLVGCSAVAEERKLGTLEGQLCLPATRRRQFAIKFFVTTGLSLLFGWLMPILLESEHPFPHDDPHILRAILFISVAIGGVSFYVSSLGRGTVLCANALDRANPSGNFSFLVHLDGRAF